MTTHSTLDCDAVRDLAPLFVMGALEAAEADAVREHLADCTEPHPEILDLGEAATALLETIEPVEPPAALRGRLLAAAEADLREGRHPASKPAAATEPAVPAPAAPAPAPEPVAVAAEPAAPRGEPAVISIELARARRRLRMLSLAVAAALIVAVGFAGWGISMNRQLDAAQAYRQGVESALALAAREGSATALLTGGDGAVTGLGVIGSDGSVQLAMRGLAPTSGAQVYTAWAIAGDAAPVPIGAFEVGSDGTGVATATSPVTGPGAVLALTLEPGPGATTPTLPIVASGTTQAPPG